MKIPPPRLPYDAATGSGTSAHPLLSVDPRSCGMGLMANCGSAAGAEALFRAFIAEHDRDRFGARFWLQVYRNIVAEERGEGDTPQ